MDDKPATGDQLRDHVHLSSPDRVLFPELGLTKRDLAAHYAARAGDILRFARDRPVSLVRCPDGRSGDCFFQKHHGPSIPEDIDTVEITEKDGDPASYLVMRSERAVVAAAQVSALELHGWGARMDRIERPDRLVVDLDPGEGVGFGTIRESAVEVREVLAEVGLATYALLTGGAGIHVVAPLERRRGWSDVKAAAEGLARTLAEAAPDRYTADAAKEKRRGRIFIDWLRNERGATAIMPYSTRAKAGAPVATPVSWDELSAVDRSAAYTMTTIGHRLSRLKEDPWLGYEKQRQSITNMLLDRLRR